MNNLQDNPRQTFVTRLPKVGVVNSRLDFILERCQGKKVLHLGCANERFLEKKLKEGLLTHLRLKKVAREVWGVDINQEGIRMLKDLGLDKLILADVEKIDEISEIKNQNFDLILATEIIEHLYNPGIFLKKIRNLFAPDTKMMISVPSSIQLTALEFSFRGYEMTHPEHNFWFSFKTLSHLLMNLGYKINEVCTYSNIDIQSSITKKILKKMWKIIARPFGTSGEKEKNNLDQTNESCLKFGFGIKLIFQIMARRFFYRLNPFFADGIIFIIELNDHQNREADG